MQSMRGTLRNPSLVCNFQLIDLTGFYRCCFYCYEFIQSKCDTSRRTRFWPEFAAADGRFWEMHDLLFENQQDLEDERLFQLAVQIGLSAQKLRRSLGSEIYQGRIDLDFREGIRSGVNGTPTFFINGFRHDGSFDFDTLLRALAEAN